MQRILIVIVCVALQGCVITGDADQGAEFAQLDDLRSVAGCYQNRGEQPSNTQDRYLSQVFWPGPPELDHKLIDYIEVSVTPTQVVVARALSGSNLVRKGEFHEGQHFEFRSGTITVKNKLFGSMAYPADNPFIGAGRTFVTLGIDESGQGRLTEKDTFAGTAFLIIPVAGHTSVTTRFVRVGNSCN